MLLPLDYLKHSCSAFYSKEENIHVASWVRSSGGDRKRASNFWPGMDEINFKVHGKEFPAWAIHLSELRLYFVFFKQCKDWSILITIIRTQLHYTKVIILLLFLCHSTQPTIFWLKRQKHDSNTANSDKGNKSGCTKTHWQQFQMPDWVNPLA